MQRTALAALRALLLVAAGCGSDGKPDQDPGDFVQSLRGGGLSGRERQLELTVSDP